MSTDRELLEMAAKAASIVGDWDEDPFDPEYSHNHKPAIKTSGCPTWWWNPLNDDGDEARLEAKLRLRVVWYDEGVRVGAGVACGENGVVEFFKDHGGDEQAARRYAGVFAAAVIGRAMP